MDRGTPSESALTGTLPVQGTGVLPVTDTDPGTERPAWLDDARGELTVPGRYLAFEAPSGGPKCVPVSREWTRIGRSLAADIRFDDATVSRRHALVVIGPDGVRVLDDRSLNGVYVNGRRVEWSPLHDGDEVAVGRHRLFFIDTATVGGPISRPEPAALAD